jgi:uncharacterized membrane protein
VATGFVYGPYYYTARVAEPAERGGDDRVGSAHGVPLRNFAGWVATTFCACLAYRLVERRLAPVSERPASVAVAAMPVAAYGAYAILYAFNAEPGALRVIALYSMGLPVLFALERLRQPR